MREREREEGFKSGWALRAIARRPKRVLEGRGQIAGRGSMPIQWNEEKRLRQGSRTAETMGAGGMKSPSDHIVRTGLGFVIGSGSGRLDVRQGKSNAARLLFIDVVPARGLGG